MDGITRVNGLYWPVVDRHCRSVVFGSEEDMIPALGLSERRGVAVQAGGNCGLWPIWLAARYRRVFTFEPDPVNFHCLDNNVPLNVTRWRAALGESPGRVSIVPEDMTNCGAHYVQDGDEVPMIAVDSLNLKACDFLCLDIEGYELLALRGARNTIEKFKPTIQIEDKGLSTKYQADGKPIQKGDAERWLASEFGYEVKHRIKRDVVLA